MKKLFLLPLGFFALPLFSQQNDSIAEPFAWGDFTWVQVTDSSRHILIKKVLRPGERYYVPDVPGAQLITSNAGGLQIFVDGSSIGSLGDKGEIVRGVRLDPDVLKKPKRVKHYE